jgi:hypothetical protein
MIKKTLYTLALTFGSIFFISTVNAQEDFNIPSQIIITEGSYSLNETTRNGYSTSIIGDFKTISEGVEDFAKDQYQIKLKTKGTLVYGEELNVPSLSDKQFNLYFDVQDDTIMCWMGLGPDVYVSTSQYPTESKNTSELLKKFIKSFYVSNFNERKEDQSKTVEQSLKELNKSKSNLQKDEKSLAKVTKSMEKNLKSIESNESKLQKIQAAIEKLENSKIELTKEKEVSESKITESQSKLNNANSKYVEQNGLLDKINTAINKINAL